MSTRINDASLSLITVGNNPPLPGCLSLFTSPCNYSYLWLRPGLLLIRTADTGWRIAEEHEKQILANTRKHA